jgi:hypothetical protein
MPDSEFSKEQRWTRCHGESVIAGRPAEKVAGLELLCEIQYGSPEIGTALLWL